MPFLEWFTKAPTIREYQSVKGIRQAFDDEASEDDFIVLGVVDGALDIEFHSNDIDELVLISLGYDQAMNLIQFLNKAIEQIPRPNNSVH